MVRHDQPCVEDESRSGRTVRESFKYSSEEPLGLLTYELCVIIRGSLPSCLQLFFRYCKEALAIRVPQRYVYVATTARQLHLVST